MGPSGAGKSTLMDLLAMRTPHDAEAPTAADLVATMTTLVPPAAAPAESSQHTVAAGTGAAGADVYVHASVRGGSESSTKLSQPQPQLLVNGMRMKRQAYMSISAYVPQVGDSGGSVCHLIPPCLQCWCCVCGSGMLHNTYCKLL